MKRTGLGLILLGALAACEASTVNREGFLLEVPESVLELAGPNQNLNAVKFLEEDGCYWYEHDGPVETTLLPLRSTRGRHLCVEREEAAAPATT